ncbi:MAG: hypothetical protein J6A94_10400 [Lachnospiraceae bacterium]|nr:hypothetical protein [Lachnospiraceae bacterium]
MQTQPKQWLLLLAKVSLITLLAVFILLSIPTTLTVHAEVSMTENEPIGTYANDLGTGIDWQHTGWLFYLVEPNGVEASDVKAVLSSSLPIVTDKEVPINNMALITISGSKFSNYADIKTNATWGAPFQNGVYRGEEVNAWLDSDSDGDGHLNASEVVAEWFGKAAALQWEAKEVYLVYEPFYWGRLIKDGLTTGYWWCGTTPRWGIVQHNLGINEDDAGDPLTKSYTNNVFPNCVVTEDFEEIRGMKLNVAAGKGGQLKNTDMYTSPTGRQVTGYGIGVAWNDAAATSTYDEPLGSTPGPAPNDKDKIKEGEPTANIVKFYENTMIKGEEKKITRASFTRTPTPKIIAIENEIPTGYKLKGWYTSSTFKSASGSSPIYDEYKSSMDNIQTGSSAKTITLGAEETTLYVLLVKSKIEEVAVEADRILYESELSKGINVGTKIESQDVTYSLHALQCKGHCPGYCPGHDDEYCEGACKDDGKTCSGHPVSCPDDGKCATHEEGSCDCESKSYCTMTLVDKALDFKRANSNRKHPLIAITSQFTDWVKPAIATRSGVAAYPIVKNYNYAYVLHRGTEDKATLCDYKPEAGNSLAADLFKYPKPKYVSNKGRTENGQYSGKIPITLLEKGADKETSAKSATCTATDTASASVNPAVEESVIVKVYRGDTTEPDTSISKDKMLYYKWKMNNTAGHQVKSGANITFYPYIRMTIQNIDGEGNPLDKQNVNVLSEYEREIIPNDYAEIDWSYQPLNLHIQSQQWALDRNLTNGDKGWNLPNQVLKGGATYSLTTDPQTVSLNTYQTISIGSAREISVIKGSCELTESSAIEAHTDFVDEAIKKYEEAEVIQYVNTDPSAETAWSDGGIQVYAGADISDLDNGSDEASTDPKYYLRTDVDNVKNITRADLDVTQGTTDTNFYRFYSDINGKIYMVSSKSADGVTSGAGTKILDKNQDESALSGMALRLNQRTGAVTKLLAAIERNTGNDTTAEWADAETDGKWYNEAYDGIVVMVQETKITIGFKVPSKRVTILDPKLVPYIQSKENQANAAFLTQYKTTLTEDIPITYFKGEPIFMKEADLLYNSNKFYIPNMTVQNSK